MKNELLFISVLDSFTYLCELKRLCSLNKSCTHCTNDTHYLYIETK